MLSDTNAHGEVELKSVSKWGNELFDQMSQVANLLDQAYQTTQYSEAIVREQAKVNDSSLTPSAQLLDIIKEQCLSGYALEKANQYQQQAMARDYQFYDQNYFNQTVPESHQAQADIEAADKVNFDDFLTQYFA